MTSKEAIRVLEDNRPSVIFEDEDAQKRMAELCQAIDMAIEALSEDISEDGTLKVKVKDGSKVNRVLVCGDNIFGGLYYPDDGDEINDMNREIIKDILKMMPTAYLLEALGVATFEELMESADRPHGVWINREYCQVDEDAYEIATCSHCKAEITLEYPYDNYCPNCGTWMHGKRAWK